MRCKGMKHKREKYDAKNCGRQATVFLRVRYKELYGRHDNGKYEDVFGFCDECARNKNSPMSWNGDRWGSGRKVLGVRGVVERIEPATADECVDEGMDKRLHDGKREFLRIMSTKGNADLADRWEEVFKLALDEFHVKKVMGE